MLSSAELLKRARQAAGITQAELARRAAIPRSVINAYERGHRQPGADTFLRILAAAGFELGLTGRIDLERNGRALAQVLDLAERLPRSPKRRLTYPPFPKRSA